MRIVSVNVGLPQEAYHEGRTFLSAIFKTPVDGRVTTLGDNLEGDRQADDTSHGGAFQAIYGYSYDHYAFWERELGELALGSFGENLTIAGLDESKVHTGDRFLAGSIELIATVPRIPCYKLAMRLHRSDMVERFLAEQKPGVYFRIAKPGRVGAGDPFERLESSDGPTIVDLMRMYVGKEHDATKRAEAAAYPSVPDRWKARLCPGVN